MLEWHFVLHSLPEDSPYAGGCYHGKMLFPEGYPHAAPSIMMLTLNGRLETGTRLCLSMTDFHPESWNPAWSVESILVGMISFMVDDRDSGIGAVSSTDETRRHLAKESWTSNIKDEEFCELFPEFCREGPLAAYPLPAEEAATLALAAAAVANASAAAGEAVSGRANSLDDHDGDSCNRALPLELNSLGRSEQAQPSSTVPGGLRGNGDSADVASSSSAAPVASEAPFHQPPSTHPAPLFGEQELALVGGTRGDLHPTEQDMLSAVCGGSMGSKVSLDAGLVSDPDAPVVLLNAEGTRPLQPADKASGLGEADSDSIVVILEPGPSPEQEATPALQEDAGEEAFECWICREDASDEPLIQPCACRGSMSGVHASCVEEWIRHHRANSPTDEDPKCSVCNQPYRGVEQRPGVVSFLRHICGDFIFQAFRSAILVVFLVAYWAAAQSNIGGTEVPYALRVAFLVCACTFFSGKVAILCVSLPRGRSAPGTPWRYLFVGEFRILTIHIAEAVATVVIAGVWSFYGQLPYHFFLPLLLMVILPMGKVVFSSFMTNGFPCNYRSCILVGMVFTSPFIIFLQLLTATWREPQRFIDPFDGCVHALISLATIPLCWFCTTNKPVVIVWILHAAFLASALLERHMLAWRLPIRCHAYIEWKEGRAWWVFLQLAMLASYVANLLHNFEDGFAGQESPYLILAISMTWLGLSCAVALSVNWDLCIRHYRAWQHQNGSFSLSSTQNANATLGAQTVIGNRLENAGDGMDPVLPAQEGPFPRGVGDGGDLAQPRPREAGDREQADNPNVGVVNAV